MKRCHFAFKFNLRRYVMVSSAGVERNARAVTPELRAAEIPIVRLNPGGTLNHKYTAEWVRPARYRPSRHSTHYKPSPLVLLGYSPRSSWVKGIL